MKQNARRKIQLKEMVWKRYPLIGYYFHPNKLIQSTVKSKLKSPKYRRELSKRLTEMIWKDYTVEEKKWNLVFQQKVK